MQFLGLLGEKRMRKPQLRRWQCCLVPSLPLSQVRALGSGCWHSSVCFQP